MVTCKEETCKKEIISKELRRASCILLSSFTKKKKSLWKFGGHDENKETKTFVRPFILLILPPLFLSVLKCTLVFLKLEPTAFSLIPKVAGLLFLCVCSFFFLHHLEIQSKKRESAPRCWECHRTPTQVYKDS